jgi:photosystem II stability/assembly factor-like uncharacterized protein
MRSVRKASLGVVSVLLSLVLSFHACAQWLPTNGPYGSTINSLAVSGTALFAGGASGVLRSTDNGTNWTSINSGLSFGLSDSSVNALAVSGINLFVSTGSGSLYGSGGLFRSANNGTSWTAVNTGLLNYFGHSAYVNSLYVSGKSLFAGTNGGIYLSTDDGATWTSANAGMPLYSTVSAFAVSGSNLFAAAGVYGMYLSTDNGTTWMPDSSGLMDSYGHTVEPSSLAVSGTNLFAGTIYGVYRSTNSGSNWVPVNSGVTNPYGVIYVNALAVSGSSLFAGTNRLAEPVCVCLRRFGHEYFCRHARRGVSIHQQRCPLDRCEQRDDANSSYRYGPLGHEDLRGE